MKWLAIVAALAMAVGSAHVEPRAVVLGMAAAAVLCLGCTRPRLRFDSRPPGRRASGGL